MYVNCRKCDFNVLKLDASCPYCGENKSAIMAPIMEKTGLFLESVLPVSQISKRKNQGKLVKSLAPWVQPSITGVIYAFFITLFASFYFVNPLILIGVFAGSAYITAAVIKDMNDEDEKKETKEINETNERKPKWLASLVKKKRIDRESAERKSRSERKKELMAAAAKESLLGREKTAQKRIEELNERKVRIVSISGKIKGTNPNSKSVKEKLIDAREMTERHIGRYRLQKQKIQLAVVQNIIVPYLDGFFELSEYAVKTGLEKCALARENLKDVKKENLNIYRFFSKNDNEEMKEFELQIEETKLIIEKLEESLLHRNALLALQEIKSIEDTFDASDFGDLAHRLETFGAKSSLVDFNESFDELELEYKRLRAENEASQKLLG